MQNRLLSFIGLGIFATLVVISLFIFSYLLVIGAIVGLVLFAIDALRHRFCRAKSTTPQKTGRTIDYRDEP